jgi:hypothetical protein
MAMVLSAWKPTQRECFGEIPNLNLSGRPGSVSCVGTPGVRFSLVKDFLSRHRKTAPFAESRV